MSTVGPLIAEYARRASVEPGNLAAALAPLLATSGALPVPPAGDREAWSPESSVIDMPTVAAVVARATAELGSPWPQPLASAAARVHRDGDRDSWEQVVFARQHRLSRAVIAAASTLNERWVDEVADGIWQLCEQSSWCWPAHDDTAARHGSVLATVTDPFLDLGAGEVVGQLAWIDHLLADALDDRYPGLRDRMAHEAATRVLEPFRRRRDWHWLGLDGNVHNWNPWIHGNVLIAALRFEADPVERARTIALVIEGLDRYVASLPADGAIDEGYGYWWNGACRALEAPDILSHATGGVLDAADVAALRATVGFPHRMQLGGAWYLNFADSQARPTAAQPWHALHRAAIRIGDGESAAHAASHRDPDGPAADEGHGLGRLLRGMSDRAWMSASPVAAPLPRDTWFASTEVMLARTAAGSTAGLALAVKGGNNGENHNHNDVGTFVVASDGVPVIVDAGRPTYTAATFGPDRYSIWTMQSSWHSVPEIRGTAQGTGAQHTARDVEARFSDASATVRLELAGAYPVPGLTSWQRSARLERATVSRVVIADTWALEPWPASHDEPRSTVRLLVAGTLSTAHGEARIVPLEGATAVILRWPADALATVVDRALDDPMLTSVWGECLHRIDIDVTERSGLELTVELDPSTSGDEQ